jgi:hypothetical protein
LEAGVHLDVVAKKVRRVLRGVIPVLSTDRGDKLLKLGVLFRVRGFQVDKVEEKSVSLQFFSESF